MVDILVVCEDNKGAIHRLSLEAIAGAQKIGNECGLSVGVLVLGENASVLSQQASQFNVNEVFSLLLLFS